MIVVKIELWPHGLECHKKELGTMHIINDGTGDLKTGNYRCEIYRWGKNKVLWRKGWFGGFRRQVAGPWDALLFGLMACIPDRFKKFGAKIIGKDELNGLGFGQSSEPQDVPETQPPAGK